jgi:hypothetical protein
MSMSCRLWFCRLASLKLVEFPEPRQRVHCSLVLLLSQPPRAHGDVSKAPAVPQAFKKNRPSFFTSFDLNVCASAVDPSVNGTARVVGAAECALARSAGSRDAAACALTASRVLDEAISSAWQSTSAAVSAAGDQLMPRTGAATCTPDAFQTGVALNEARLQTEAARAREAQSTVPGPHFRVSDAVLARLEAVVARYVGTHAFHNFTPRLTFGDASTVRFIKEARVSRPFIAGSGPSALECVRITFVGQSFLLNQIRHMVGLAVDIARGAAPPFVMQVCRLALRCADLLRFMTKTAAFLPV